MGYLAFFLLLSAACLLWSAACTAAAARSARPRLRSLLLVVGLALPVLALLPWLWASGWLAFGARIRPNWFGPVLTVVLSALVGGLSIAIGGLGKPAGTTTVRAAQWPMIGLFGLAILAKAVSFGTLLILDNAVAAEARAMRVEAAAVMQAALPPAVADAENAAILHAQAAAAFAAATDLKAADGLFNAPAIDASSPAVGELLTRHAGLLDTIRRAADMPACRFPRDWTRPSIDMLLAEVQSCRTEGRLLAIAARHEAATGKPAAALADAVRLGRIGRHVGSEPILISHLVGIAIDATALSVVAEILPTLTPADAPLLEPTEHLLLGRLHCEPIEEARVHKLAVTGVGRRRHIATRDDLDNRKLELTRELPVPLVMSWHRHDRPRAVAREHIVGDPDRQPRTVHRVRRIGPREDTRLLLRLLGPVELRLPRCGEHIGLHSRPLLLRDNA